MLFGIHLVRHGLITSDQFVDALERHLHSRVPIGRLAMEAGYVSMKQVFEILRVQGVTGQKFGQIGVEMGYFTEQQLSELLAVQASRDMSVAEVIVHMGFLSEEQMKTEMEIYRRRQTETI